VLIPLITSSLILGWNTCAGLAVYADSVTYLWAARSLHDGHGFATPDVRGRYEPVTFFPPLYSLALSTVDPKNDLMPQIRRLNIFLDLFAIALAIVSKI
jgi:hypothetical protein